jgi:hypothetical protein
MTNIVCHLRTHRECACAPDECRASPEPRPAPIISFTIRDHLVAIAFWTVVALIAVGTIHALGAQEREYQISRRV